MSYKAVCRTAPATLGLFFGGKCVEMFGGKYGKGMEMLTAGRRGNFDKSNNSL